jgi:hypothetical protein
MITPLNEREKVSTGYHKPGSTPGQVTNFVTFFDFLQLYKFGIRHIYIKKKIFFLNQNSDLVGEL